MSPLFHRHRSLQDAPEEMDEPLFRFAYTSTAGAQFAEADLLHLRLTGENYNDRNGVTGLLLFDGRRFAQLVEGPRVGLDHIVDRIVRDPRHGNMEILYRGPAAERQFEGWALKARWKSARGAPDTFVAEVEAAVARVPERAIATYFVEFARSGG